MTIKKTKKDRVKDRIALEARFIGRLISEADFGNIRDEVAAMGLKWRQFYDKRHQAIWRALETLDLKSSNERMDAIEEEAYAAAEEKIKELKDGGVSPKDIVWGEPGSAASKAFQKKLVDEAGSGILWLERALGDVGALRLAGGKEYLRALVDVGIDKFLTPIYLRDCMLGIKNDFR